MGYPFCYTLNVKGKENNYWYLKNYFKLKKEELFRICLHEAGHILICEKYTKNNDFIFCHVENNKGDCLIKTKSNSLSNKEEELSLYLSGFVTELVFFKEISKGSNHDLKRAFDIIFNDVFKKDSLVQLLHYFSLYKDSDTNFVTFAHSFNLFKNLIFKRKVKELKRIIRKEKKQIIRIGMKLMVDKSLTKDELKKILN